MVVSIIHRLVLHRFRVCLRTFSLVGFLCSFSCSLGFNFSSGRYFSEFALEFCFWPIFSGVCFGVFFEFCVWSSFVRSSSWIEYPRRPRIGLFQSFFAAKRQTKNTKKQKIHKIYTNNDTRKNTRQTNN